MPSPPITASLIDEAIYCPFGGGLHSLRVVLAGYRAPYWRRRVASPPLSRRSSANWRADVSSWDEGCTGILRSLPAAAWAGRAEPAGASASDAPLQSQGYMLYMRVTPLATASSSAGGASRR